MVRVAAVMAEASAESPDLIRTSAIAARARSVSGTISVPLSSGVKSSMFNES